MRVAVALRKTGDALCDGARAGIGPRKHLRLSALFAATFATLTGCAPERASSTSPAYSTSRPRVSQAFDAPRRAASMPRIARSRLATKSQGQPPIPLPDKELLVPQLEPSCEAGNKFNGNQADAERMKLDYERQCYRQAEIIARNRLKLLQVAVGETIKAAILGNTK
jgi:hypothetical protein